MCVVRSSQTGDDIFDTDDGVVDHDAKADNQPAEDHRIQPPPEQANDDQSCDQGERKADQ